MWDQTAGYGSKFKKGSAPGIILADGPVVLVRADQEEKRRIQEVEEEEGSGVWEWERQFGGQLKKINGSMVDRLDDISWLGQFTITNLITHAT